MGLILSPYDTVLGDVSPSPLSIPAPSRSVFSNAVTRSSSSLTCKASSIPGTTAIHSHRGIRSLRQPRSLDPLDHYLRFASGLCTELEAARTQLHAGSPFVSTLSSTR